MKTWTHIVTDITKNNSLSKSKKTSKLSKKIMGITEEEKIDILTLYLKSCETKHHIEFIKYRMLMNEGGGENFDNENKITVLEYLYQEIEKVLFGKESNSIKKSECDQKSSRREGEKKESTLHNSLTKPNNRQKGAWQAQDGSVKYKPPPLFRYILNHEQMLGLITRVTHMTKKNFEKVDKLLGKEPAEEEIKE